MSLQGNGPQIVEVIENTYINIEYISVVQIKSINLTIFYARSSLKIPKVRVFQAPFSTIFCTLAIENLNSGFSRHIF